MSIELNQAKSFKIIIQKHFLKYQISAQKTEKGLGNNRERSKKKTEKGVRKTEKGLK